MKIGIALSSTTLNVQIESGQTDGYTLLKRAPSPGPYSACAYGFASGQDLNGRSNVSWQLASSTIIPGTPVYKNLVGGTDLTGQSPASANTWLSSHVLGLTTPTPPMAPPLVPTPRKLDSFISGGLFELTEAQWNAVWTAADPNRGTGSGLLTGYPYYLSDIQGTFFLIDTTGTPPVAFGNWITKCFVALSSTTVLIQISDPRKVESSGTFDATTTTWPATHVLSPTPFSVTVSAIAAGEAQTNGTFTVKIYDSYGAGGLINGLATTGLSGWSETGWSGPSGGVYTNTFTKAVVPVATDLITFDVIANTNTGFIYIATNIGSVPQTTQDSGIGNLVSVDLN